MENTFNVGDSVTIPTHITAISYDDDGRKLYNVAGSIKDYYEDELIKQTPRLEFDFDKNDNEIVNFIGDGFTLSISKATAIVIAEKILNNYGYISQLGGD